MIQRLFALLLLGSGFSWASGIYNPGSTNFIQNTSTLQAGATFYVSSGTIVNQLNITGSGSEPSPALTIGQAGTGFYNSGSQLTLSINGTRRLNFLANGFSSSQNNDSSGLFFSGGDLQVDSNHGAIKLRNGGSGVVYFQVDTVAQQVSIPTATSGGLSVSYNVSAGSLTVIDGSSTDSYMARVSTAATGAFAVSISTNNHVMTNGSSPSISSCGSGPSGSVVGDDNQGAITVGGGSVTACTLTFSKTWGTTPVCVISDNSVAITGDISSISATAFTASFSLSLGGGTIYYHCGCFGASCL